MKKSLLPILIVLLSLSLNIGFAKDNKKDLQVTGGQGSLKIETMDKSKITVTIRNSEGELILSEIIKSGSGKLQLLGLKTGLYQVEVRSKKNSKSFQVEVE